MGTYSLACLFMLRVRILSGHSCAWMAGSALSLLSLAHALLSDFCPQLVWEAGTHTDNDTVMRGRVTVERCPEYNESTEGRKGQAGRSRMRSWVLKMEPDLVECRRQNGPFMSRDWY